MAVTAGMSAEALQVLQCYGVDTKDYNKAYARYTSVCAQLSSASDAASDATRTLPSRVTATTAAMSTTTTRSLPMRSPSPSPPQTQLATAMVVPPCSAHELRRQLQRAWREYVASVQQHLARTIRAALADLLPDAANETADAAADAAAAAAAEDGNNASSSANDAAATHRTVSSPALTTAVATTPAPAAAVVAELSVSALTTSANTSQASPQPPLASSTSVSATTTTPTIAATAAGAARTLPVGATAPSSPPPLTPLARAERVNELCALCDRWYARHEDVFDLPYAERLAQLVAHYVASLSVLMRLLALRLACACAGSVTFARALLRDAMTVRWLGLCGDRDIGAEVDGFLQLMTRMLDVQQQQQQQQQHAQPDASATTTTAGDGDGDNNKASCTNSSTVRRRRHDSTTRLARRTRRAHDTDDASKSNNNSDEARRRQRSTVTIIAHDDDDEDSSDSASDRDERSTAHDHDTDAATAATTVAEGHDGVTTTTTTDVVMSTASDYPPVPFGWLYRLVSLLLPREQVLQTLPAKRRSAAVSAALQLLRVSPARASAVSLQTVLLHSCLATDGGVTAAEARGIVQTLLALYDTPATARYLAVHDLSVLFTPFVELRTSASPGSVAEYVARLNAAKDLIVDVLASWCGNAWLTSDDMLCLRTLTDMLHLPGDVDRRVVIVTLFNQLLVRLAPHRGLVRMDTWRGSDEERRLHTAAAAVTSSSTTAMLDGSDGSGGGGASGAYAASPLLARRAGFGHVDDDSDSDNDNNNTRRHDLHSNSNNNTTSSSVGRRGVAAAAHDDDDDDDSSSSSGSSADDEDSVHATAAATTTAAAAANNNNDDDNDDVEDALLTRDVVGYHVLDPLLGHVLLTLQHIGLPLALMRVLQNAQRARMLRERSLTLLQDLLVLMDTLLPRATVADLHEKLNRVVGKLADEGDLFVGGQISQRRKQQQQQQQRLGRAPQQPHSTHAMRSRTGNNNNDNKDDETAAAMSRHTHRRASYATAVAAVATRGAPHGSPTLPLRTTSSSAAATATATAASSSSSSFSASLHSFADTLDVDDATFACMLANTRIATTTTPPAVSSPRTRMPVDACLTNTSSSNSSSSSSSSRANTDVLHWDFAHVLMLVHGPLRHAHRLHASMHVLRLLVAFYTPRDSKTLFFLRPFSTLRDADVTPVMCRAGVQLLCVLLTSREGTALLRKADYGAAVAAMLRDVLPASSPHASRSHAVPAAASSPPVVSVLTPSRVHTRVAHTLLRMVGRLTCYANGLLLMHEAGVFAVLDQLFDAVATTTTTTAVAADDLPRRGADDEAQVAALRDVCCALLRAMHFGSVANYGVCDALRRLLQRVAVARATPRRVRLCALRAVQRTLSIDVFTSLQWGVATSLEVLRLARSNHSNSNSAASERDTAALVTRAFRLLLRVCVSSDDAVDYLITCAPAVLMEECSSSNNNSNSNNNSGSSRVLARYVGEAHWRALLYRLVSRPGGVRFVQTTHAIDAELRRWESDASAQYVQQLHDSYAAVGASTRSLDSGRTTAASAVTSTSTTTAATTTATASSSSSSGGGGRRVPRCFPVHFAAVLCRTSEGVALLKKSAWWARCVRCLLAQPLVPDSAYDRNDSASDSSASDSDGEAERMTVVVVGGRSGGGVGGGGGSELLYAPFASMTSVTAATAGLSSSLLLLSPSQRAAAGVSGGGGGGGGGSSSQQPHYYYHHPPPYYQGGNGNNSSNSNSIAGEVAVAGASSVTPSTRSALYADAAATAAAMTGDFTPAQRAVVAALLRTRTSADGVAAATTVANATAAAMTPEERSSFARGVAGGGGSGGGKEHVTGGNASAAAAADVAWRQMWPSSAGAIAAPPAHHARLLSSHYDNNNSNNNHATATAAVACGVHDRLSLSAPGGMASQQQQQQQQQHMLQLRNGNDDNNNNGSVCALDVVGDVQQLLEAMLCIGHAGSSDVGYALLRSQPALLKHLLALAHAASTVSVRCMAQLCLCILARAPGAASELRSRGYVVLHQTSAYTSVDGVFYAVAMAHPSKLHSSVTLARTRSMPLPRNSSDSDGNHTASHYAYVDYPVASTADVPRRLYESLYALANPVRREAAKTTLYKMCKRTPQVILVPRVLRLCLDCGSLYPLRHAERKFIADLITTAQRSRAAAAAAAAAATRS